MNTKVDRFGRVVLPKAVRDELGLEPGTPLTVREEGSRIVLEASRDPASGLVRTSDGVLVWEGESASDLEDAVRRLRRERLGRLARPPR